MNVLKLVDFITPTPNPSPQGGGECLGRDFDQTIEGWRWMHCREVPLPLVGRG